MMQLKAVYGFDSEKLGGIRVGNQSMASVLDRGILLDLNKSTLFIHSPLPVLKTAVPDAALGQVHPRATWVGHYLPEVCEHVLNAYVHEYRPAFGEILFLWQPSEIKSRCQAFISKINKTKNGQMTLKRIEKYLPRRMACMGPSGPALTNLALGRNDHPGLVEVHYLRTSVPLLRFHHSKTLRHIQNQMEEKQ
jgi:hypothetical protein